MKDHPTLPLSGLSRRSVVGRAVAVGAALSLGGRLGRAAAQDATPSAGPAEFVWETRGDPDGPLGNPSHLAIALDGSIWVADADNDRFLIFAPDGSLLEVRSINAQESFATPGPGEFKLAPVQIGRELTSGRIDEPPAGPLELGLVRFTSDPGSVFPGAEDDPSVDLILVESGMMTARIEAPVMIIRATGTEEVAAGTEFTLGPGESFVWPPNVFGETRNDGQEPAVTLVAFLVPVEEEAATPMAGSPTP